jgi:glutamate--cysteine ligase catalytic subunit
MSTIDSCEINGLYSVTLQWEWASYVVETTPAKPYTERIEDLMAVEGNMKRRWV